MAFEPIEEILAQRVGRDHARADRGWSRRRRARPRAAPTSRRRAGRCAARETSAAWPAPPAPRSPISSRNSVPPSAISTSPSLRSRASEKAPRSCPNSSLSTSVSGIAEQLSSTNGPPARGEPSCSMRAIACLPVPLSPVTSTIGTGLAAITCTSRSSSRHAGRGVNEGAAVGALALLRRHVGDPLLERAGAGGVADGGDDLLQLERLLDEVVAAQLHRGRPRSRSSRARRSE